MAQPATTTTPCTCTPEFHQHLLESLGALQAGQSAIIGRLDKINGSVGKLYERTEGHARELAVIQSEHLDTRVGALEKTAAEDSGAGKVYRMLKPVAGLLLLLNVVLLLLHGDVVLAVLKK